MLVNILLFTFVSAFAAIVAVGHVLLLQAIWPGVSGTRLDVPSDADAVAGATHIQQSN